MTLDAFDAWLLDPDRRPLVMGVLNVTPDSFSDGGRFDTAEAAYRRAAAMIAGGADLIDVGGESTRPGAARIDAAEQIARVVPVLQACAALPTLFSIDTTRADVARAAFDAGATILNDVSAGRDDPEMLPLAAECCCPVVLMHMLGEPATMQDAPEYDDVVADVADFLDARARAFEAAGIAPHRILVDPGLGFGKTLEHNLALLAATRRLADAGRPVLIGASRKGFIGKLTGRADPADRVFGTAAAVAWAVTQGAAVVRVHDVDAMKDVALVAHAIGRSAAR